MAVLSITPERPPNWLIDSPSGLLERAASAAGVVCRGRGVGAVWSRCGGVCGCLCVAAGLLLGCSSSAGCAPCRPRVRLGRSPRNYPRGRPRRGSFDVFRESALL